MGELCHWYVIVAEPLNAVADVIPVICSGWVLKQTDWVPLIVPGELIIFSIIVNDDVAAQPDGVVTRTVTKMELVKGAEGIKSTDVWVAVAVTRLENIPFKENSYEAPAIPPAVAVILKVSSSQIILFNLSDEIVAFGVVSTWTATGLDIDEHAEGSGFPPKSSLL